MFSTSIMERFFAQSFHSLRKNIADAGSVIEVKTLDDHFS